MWRSTHPLGAMASLTKTASTVELSMVVDHVAEDPDRWLVIGPDRAANLLEIVVLVTAEGDELLIHAMPLRPVYRRLLEP